VRELIVEDPSRSDRSTLDHKGVGKNACADSAATREPTCRQRRRRGSNAEEAIGRRAKRGMGKKEGLPTPPIKKEGAPRGRVSIECRRKS